VKALSMKLKITGLMLTTTKILSQFPKPGVTMKQMMLILMCYKDPLYLAALIKTINNHAHQNGVEQIFCVCEPGDVLLKSMKGFLRVNTALHLYIKPLTQDFDLVDGPVYVNGIDL
jgi:hypothetical protein